MIAMFKNIFFNKFIWF